MPVKKPIHFIDISNITKNMNTNNIIWTLYHTEFCNIDFKSIYLSDSKLHVGETVLDVNDITDNAQAVLFENCTFEQILVSGKLNCNISFHNCKIGSFQIDNLEEWDQDNKKIYDITFEESCEINQLSIFKSTLCGKFYVNPQRNINNKNEITIQSISISDSIFKENFKLHNCKITEVSMENIDFEKNADFFKSEFLNNKPTKLSAVNFRGLALFGKCIFHNKLVLEYITFESLTHFKEAHFYEGIDLDRTNIQKEINFFGVIGLMEKDSVHNTSQETYRIIKHNFQKLGNNIEANRYHSLELSKRQEYVNQNWKTNLLDWFIFNINWASSQFSRNWFLTLFWIFIVGILTYFSVDYFVCLRHGCIDSWTDFFKYMSIVNLDDCLKKNPLIFLLNKLFLGYLYYQFITAVRKDTKK